MIGFGEEFPSNSVTLKSVKSVPCFADGKPMVSSLGETLDSLPCDPHHWLVTAEYEIEGQSG